MKKFIFLIVFGILLNGATSIVYAQDLLPSESFYNENIAVNDVDANAPVLRLPDNGNANGPGDGNVEWGDGGFVGAPVGDAILPISVAVLLYGTVLVLRKRRKTSN